MALQEAELPTTRFSVPRSPVTREWGLQEERTGCSHVSLPATGKGQREGASAPGSRCRTHGVRPSTHVTVHELCLSALDLGSGLFPGVCLTSFLTVSRFGLADLTFQCYYDMLVIFLVHGILFILQYIFM